MDLVSSARRFAFKVILLILCSAILLWFSIFFYGIVYFLYIPAVAHVHPVYLQYDAVCARRICKFPSANVSLVKPGYPCLLTGGQQYAVEVILEMPESEKNRKQGMFMIKLSMASASGVVLQTSSRPAVLHYRSPLFRTIYTIFFSPALLAGTFEEKQKLVVPLFENYIEDSYQPTHFAIIEIHAHFAEIYSCALRIHAQFTGLRYFMYYWPLSSACVIIGAVFFLLCIMTLLIWVRCIMNSPTDEVTDLKKESRKTSLSSHGQYNTSNPATIANLLARPSDQSEQQNPPSEGMESGIEVLSMKEETLDSQRIPEIHEAESDLVVGLRKRKQ